MFPLLATLIIFLVTLLLVYDWQKHSYWRSKGVPTPTYLPVIGHTYHFFVGLHWENVAKMYKRFKSNGMWGMYEGFRPTCYVSDPAHIREIMVKDADHFIDRRPMTFTGETKIFNEMLSMMKGEKWKSLRTFMSPTFTSGKIKSMFPLIDDVVKDFVKECENEMNENFFVKINSLFGYYTMDVIGTCAFGIDAHCLEHKDNSPFVKHANSLSSFDVPKILKLIVTTLSPTISKAFGLQRENDEDILFFCKVVEHTVEMRRKSNIKRGDFLDMLLEALDECEKTGNDAKYPMTFYTVKAESLLFLLAGFDTTANALSFAAYLLAKNSEPQTKLRQELQKIIEDDGELNYQNVMEAPYLDACLSESLRLFSPAHMTERLCTKNFTLSGTNVEIKENTIVGIPVWSLHRDPEYWEDPLSFRPERFLPENKGNITPYTYLPFGLGPRNCIGMRFAQMEAKLLIARLCLNFEIELRPGFTEMVLQKTLSTLRPNQDGVKLFMKKINKTNSK